MPWKEVSAMSQRDELVELARQPGVNLTALCRRFCVSRKTAYKWIDRAEREPAAALLDRSRRPHHSPGRCGDGLEQQVVQLRREHPAWGARKIRQLLPEKPSAAGVSSATSVPAVSTVHRILVRQGLIDDPAWRKHTAFLRFEYPGPNDLWQADFKGHFGGLLREPQLRCHPLCVLDDHSRYALGICACADEEGLTVQGHLTTLFRRFGLPAGMLMDNGSCWARQTKLSVWLMRLGVRVLHGRVRHPQTQGKLERFNRTLKAEAIGCDVFADLPDCQRRFDQWRDVYNLRRPHEALGLATPASRYRPSGRCFPEVLPEITYGPADAVRVVNGTGFIAYQSRRWMIGQAYVGLPVGVRPTLDDGVSDVYFCQQKVAQIRLRAENPS